MRDRWERLPKALRLAVLVGAMGLLVLCLWLEAGRPRLTPQGALRLCEQRGLLEYGDFLGHEFAFPAGTGADVDYFTAVSRTKTQLHLAEIRRQGLWWEQNERVVALPVEEPVTAALLPWQINIESRLTAYPAAVVYCPEPEAHRVEGTLTIGGRPLSGRAGRGEGACWLVAFESLYEEGREAALSDFRQLWSWYHYHLPLPEGSPITLTVAVYDDAGNLLAEKQVDYPPRHPDKEAKHEALRASRTAYIRRLGL